MPEVGLDLITKPDHIPTPARFSRERITEILGRLRMLGGLPPKPEYTYRLTTWMRTLSTRGLADADLLRDPEQVKARYQETFPLSTTRSQYAMTFLKYLTALTETEYQSEYAGLDRSEVVTLLKGIISQASKERKAAEQARQESK